MFEIVRPSPILADYVEYFWRGTNVLDDKISFTHYASASSRTELLFHCAGDFFESSEPTKKVFDAGFYGQTNVSRRYQTFSKRSVIFGARLYPHALGRFFGWSAMELTDERIELETALGTAGSELSEQIFALDDFAAQSALLENFLARQLFLRLRKTDTGDEFWRRIYSAEAENLTIVARNFGLSNRQFERIFKSRTGFSFAHFRKLKRFEKAVAALENFDGLLTEIALCCGYFDQSHFIRDFKFFSGSTPKFFLKQREEI